MKMKRFKILVPLAIWIAAFLTGKFVLQSGDGLKLLLASVGIPPAVSSVAATMGFVFVLCYGLKIRAMGAIPEDLQRIQTSFGEFPALDTSALYSYTRQLESAGFVRLMDYRLHSPSETTPPTFARLFSSSEKGSFAEVSQVFQRHKPPRRMACTIHTTLENGWSVTTADRKPELGMYLARGPRRVWICLPGARTSNLLLAHATRANQVAYALQVRARGVSSSDLYFQEMKLEMLARVEALKHKNVLGFLLDTLAFSLGSRHEWLAGYPDAARARSVGPQYAGKN